MKFDLSFLHTSLLTLLGVVTITGFYMGLIAKRVNLPTIIGYMILGVILGPSVLNIFDDHAIQQLSFLSEIALGFVAFTIGSELSLSSLKRIGKGIIIVIFAESVMAFLIVTAAIYALTRDLPLSIIFGAMAPASAPAGTVAIIQEYKARGSLTKSVYAVVGFDDGLAVIIFGFAAALSKNLLIAECSNTATSILPALWTPVLEISLSLILGGFIGIIFSRIIGKLHNSRDIFIILFGVVFFTTGLSIHWNLSYILANMMVGFVLVNDQSEAVVQSVRTPLGEIMPLVFLLFFCLAGAHLRISAIPALGGIGVVYILGRSAGLTVGAYWGAKLGRLEKKIQKYLGFCILSQAGVAIGLSLIVNNDFSRIAAEYNLPHAAKIGAIVLATITATCIFFEIIGPVLTKFALTRAGEISNKKVKSLVEHNDKNK